MKDERELSLLTEEIEAPATEGRASTSAEAADIFSQAPGAEDARLRRANVKLFDSGRNNRQAPAYECGDLGNATKETRNGAETAFAYDAFVQPIRANDPADPTARNYSAVFPLSKPSHAYTAQNATPSAASYTLPHVYSATRKKHSFKRQSVNRHSIQFLFVFAFIFLISNNFCSENACGYNSSIEQNSCSFISGGSNTYAWNERYLFAAIGRFFSEEEAHAVWIAPHYTIYRIDRITGSVKLLVKDYPYQFMHLLIDGDLLYLLNGYTIDTNMIIDHWNSTGNQSEMPAFTTDDDYGSTHLTIMDFEGNTIEDLHFRLDSIITGAIVLENMLYLTTCNNVYYIDINSGKQYDLFHGSFVLNDF